MRQVEEFFRKLLDTSDWPPRWHCGRWSEFHGWLYIISDLMVWSAYFCIPLIILYYFSKRRKDLQFHRIYLLFAAFIIACGTTHFVDAIIFWYPVYRLSAFIRLLTGIVSWITVVALFRTLPVAFSFKSPRLLEHEIELRTKVEEELRIKNDLLSEAQKIARLGYWRWDLADNKMYWNEETYHIWGIEPGTAMDFNRYLDTLHPADKTYVLGILEEARRTGELQEFHHRIINSKTGEVQHILARGQVEIGDQGAVLAMKGTLLDVTRQRDKELQLIAKSRQLERINEELQNFAYIASHDLQEPLRKVITFSSLLQHNAGDTLSQGQQVYLDKIGSSALRMQRLIQDILAFSRLTDTNAHFVRTDLNLTLKMILSEMEVTIQETGAQVRAEKLPEMEAIPVQMEQLFQNLLSNALKFHKTEEKPRLYIFSDSCTGRQLSAADQAQIRHFNPALSDEDMNHLIFHRLYVQDNGIGFDAIYAEKIFTIFQRLHARHTYDGTGIGLAICKRIADNHHGLIRAESVPGKGALFIITLPANQHLFTHQIAAG